MSSSQGLYGRYRALIGAAVAVLLLTGCPGSTDPPPDSAGPTATGSVTSPGAPGTSPPAGTPGDPGSPPTAGVGTTVTVVRGGGFAGVQDTITVRPDGSWTSTDRAGDRRTGRLAPAQAHDLRALVTDPGLAGEAHRPPGPDGSSCNDTFTYQVTVGDTVITYLECPADDPPPPLAAAIVALVMSAAER